MIQLVVIPFHSSPARDPTRARALGIFHVTRLSSSSSTSAMGRAYERARGLPVGAGLDREQLGVLAAAGHEVVVAADLDDAGAVEDDDQVGHAHGREAVRHEDRDAPVGGVARAAASA